jgi:hypothetical protein
MRVTLTQPRNEMSLVGCKGIQGAWAGVPMWWGTIDLLLHIVQMGNEVDLRDTGC